MVGGGRGLICEGRRGGEYWRGRGGGGNVMLPVVGEGSLVVIAGGGMVGWLSDAI